ncbi:MAG TPA: chemotaxis protein CheA [Solirubrobacteraceae bacterium]|nr:chemotaxis protein CheA [Solirubrobacteraceae bacterium]
MDISEYLPMFLAEGREHLQELNLAVVRIEGQPDDPATVDEIFRIAHSMKGMSATMGFAGMAALTHEMEDVFELLRQRRGGLEREAIDVLLQCLDALAEAVDAIEENGAESIAPEPLIARLRELVRDRTPGQDADRHGSHEPVADVESLAPGERVVHVCARLRGDAQMPAVRAYMVLSALAEKGRVVTSAPSEEGVDAFTGREIDVWLATEEAEDALLALAGSVPDVEAVEAAVEAPKAEEAEAEEAEAEAEAEAGTGTPPAGAPAPGGAGTHKSKGASTVRVDAERLDQLMHFMGELMRHRTQVEGLVAQADVPGLSQAMQNLTRSSHALQQMVMQVRMIPVEAVFLRFPRLVRDLSTKLGKQVELSLVGKETQLDRTVVDALGDPLVHLVRNALDHGLEPPEERVAAGKPATGTLEISARHAGGNVVISVRDDGRGIDPRKVARKAAERGLIPADAVDSIDVKAAAELLFHPGFSTAEVTSDISGRGVGMDAVRTTVRELGGEVLLHSEQGQGTTAQVRLPLTIAIVAALLVEVGGEPFAVPIDRIERTVKLADHALRSVAGERMLVMRDGVLPLVDGGARLGREATPEADHGVIVRTADARLALAVTKLVGQQELVTRPLPAAVAEHAALSGGAVLPSGQIALIVDCDALGEGAARVPAPALA